MEQNTCPGPTPEEGQRIFMAVVAELGLSVPYQADRWANVGETCTCGQPAHVVYVTSGYGDLGFCGRHG